MTGLVLDAGALLAVDRGDRRVGAMLRVAQEAEVPMATSAGAVAQVWRDGARQARLARVLAGIAIRTIDADTARSVGVLLGQAHSADVIDAHVAAQAGPGDRVLTSDPEDITTLLRARGIEALVVRV
jgi:hypothetical protein